MTTPDTVTEAVEFLATQGYVDDYRLCDAGIVAGDCRRRTRSRQPSSTSRSGSKGRATR